ncbi:MAG TPA: CHAD domain-containing protein [Chitinophagaceae bacterium]|nr:CHAD domain-containing protein [Chitinophagaceae bacterium]
MKKEELRHISTSHYRKIQKHLDGIVEDMDGEEIHQLRVEYKKLRAFFRMLSSTPRVKEEIKVSKKLKQLYSLYGTVRDLQLQQKRIKEAVKNNTQKISPYLDLLQSEIDKTEPELQDILSKKPVQESKKKTNAGLPDKFLKHDFHQFVEDKWSSVYAILASGHYSDDNIHSIRKHLKDLFYNLKEYEGKKIKVLSAGIWKGQDEKFIAALLDELGTFQDRCTSISLLKAYWIKRFVLPVRKLLDELKQQWIKEKTGMKRVLVRKMQTGIKII